MFVIHVDGKEIADETHRELTDFASSRSYVHVLPDEYRVRVNWGGFTSECQCAVGRASFIKCAFIHLVRFFRLTPDIFTALFLC